MKRLIRTFLLPPLIAVSAIGAAGSEELDLGDLDREAWLLGAIDMPRLQSSGNETVNETLRHFVFNNRKTAEAFVATAKSIGVDDIALIGADAYMEGLKPEDRHGVAPAHFVRSEELERRFRPFLVFADVRTFADVLEAERELSLPSRYAYPFRWNQVTERLTVNAQIQAVDRIAYPDLRALDTRQQRAFLLGFVAARATFNENPAKPGVRPPKYMLRFIRLKNSYAEEIDALMKEAGVAAAKLANLATSDDPNAVDMHAWEFDLPPDYERVVAPLIERRAASVESELAYGPGAQVVAFYDIFYY